MATRGSRRLQGHSPEYRLDLDIHRVRPPRPPPNPDPTPTGPRGPKKPRKSPYSRPIRKPPVAIQPQCDLLAILLNQADARAIGANVPDPELRALIRKPLFETTVSRAIASVTEAINQAHGSTLFALVDYQDLSRLHQEASGAPPAVVGAQHVAGPAHEAFLVRTDAGDDTANLARPVDHSSLYHLRRAPNPNQGWIMDSYDSARRNHHRANNAATADEFVNHLRTMRWGTAAAQPVAPGAIIQDPAARQLGVWESGIYNIVYAWALALGLDISNFRHIPPLRNPDLLSNAVQIVNLALQGLVSSTLIEAFLKCYRVVDNDAIVPADREFDNSVALLRNVDFREHLARRRVQELIDSRPYDHLPPTAEELIKQAQCVDPSLNGAGLWNMHPDAVHTADFIARAYQRSLTPPRNRFPRSSPIPSSSDDSLFS